MVAYYPPFVVGYGRTRSWRKQVSPYKEVSGVRWATMVFKLTQTRRGWCYCRYLIRDEVCGNNSAPSGATVERAKQHAKEKGYPFRADCQSGMVAKILFPIPIPTTYDRLLSDGWLIEADALP